MCVLLSSSATGCVACTNLGRFDTQAVPGGPVLGISQNGFSDVWGLYGDYEGACAGICRENVETGASMVLGTQF